MTEPDPSPAPLRVGYERGPARARLAEPDVLAVIGFGAAADLPDGDPRALRVGLEPLGPAEPPLEVWRSGGGPVRHGRDGDLRWSSDGEWTFFALDLDEAAHGGLAEAAARAYAQLTAFAAASATPHLLRIWNYLDAINLGDGDEERYRRFCDGRARGLAARPPARYPAATAIGRQDGVRSLQVYGLAGAAPGRAVENPRQVSAWRYPRQYGPTPPAFTRAMLAPPAGLLISGTAAVVGHASAHQDDLDAQLDETLANLDSLLRHAMTSSQLGPQSLLKAYLRDPRDAGRVAAHLGGRFPALGGLLLLGGDICRSELLIEIDGIHAGGA